MVHRRSLFFVIYTIILLVFLSFPSEMVIATRVQVPKTKEQLKNFLESKVGAGGSSSPGGGSGAPGP
uniref:Uncharacterized protein n=1 Tax=Manihot esculenta TaxID=3983 RepID=A0A2C9U7C3_MANES